MAWVSCAKSMLTTNPGAILPGLFFDALSSIRCFPDLPNPFSTSIRMPRIFYGANAETCPAHTRAAGLELGGPALRTAAPRAHRTLSLRPSPATSWSPDVRRRLLETNRKSIRIPLPQGTGDPLHAAFEIVQQLALQGHLVAAAFSSCANPS